ncbi:MAG: HAMP domain-containing sensor histidine kinase [bacterium]
MKIKNLLIYCGFINVLTYILLIINFFLLKDRMGDGTYFIATVNVLILLTLVDIFIFVIYKIQKNKDDTLNKFISNSIHTLRTPLNVINANVELLEMDSKNEFLDNIKFESDKMDRITTNLLKYTIFKEKDFLDPVKLNISEPITNECKNMDVVLKANNKKFSYSVEENIYWMVSEIRLMVILTTLLDNASKYSKREVDCNLTSEYLEIINDTILEDGDYFYLFERFERNQQETKGFGIGLSIVKLICDETKIKLEASVKNGQMIIRLNKNKMDID